MVGAAARTCCWAVANEHGAAGEQLFPVPVGATVKTAGAAACTAGMPATNNNAAATPMHPVRTRLTVAMFATVRTSSSVVMRLALGRHPGRLEDLDQLGVEGREVVRLAAADDRAGAVGVDVDLLVDPGAAGIADVGLQAGPRRQRAALQHAGLGQRP